MPRAQIAKKALLIATLLIPPLPFKLSKNSTFSMKLLLHVTSSTFRQHSDDSRLSKLLSVESVQQELGEEYWSVFQFSNSCLACHN